MITSQEIAAYLERQQDPKKREAAGIVREASAALARMMNKSEVPVGAYLTESVASPRGIPLVRLTLGSEAIQLDDQEVLTMVNELLEAREGAITDVAIFEFCKQSGLGDDAIGPMIAMIRDFRGKRRAAHEARDKKHPPHPGDIGRGA